MFTVFTYVLFLCKDTLSCSYYVAIDYQINHWINRFEWMYKKTSVDWFQECLFYYICLEIWGVLRNHLTTNAFWRSFKPEKRK